MGCVEITAPSVTCEGRSLWAMNGAGESRSWTSSARSAQTRSYYEQRAEEYARGTGGAVPLPLIDGFLSALKSGGRIIDLGCGGGRDLATFRERKFDAIGLDFSEPLLRLARERAGAPVVLADIQKLPFADMTFDGAWALASLLHISREEMPIALKEICRILRPGGAFFSSMKAGSVDGVDVLGRWFSYFEGPEWAECVIAAGLKIVKLEHDTEVRRSGSTIERITWINCLASRES